jgi:hypothetical protein
MMAAEPQIVDLESEQEAGSFNTEKTRTTIFGRTTTTLNKGEKVLPLTIFSFSSQQTITSATTAGKLLSFLLNIATIRNSVNFELNFYQILL